MNVLLVGERPAVLLAKYKMLEKNWQMKIQQCYSLEVAQDKLKHNIFDCLIYIPFFWQDRKAQFIRLAHVNKQYNVPIRILEEE